MSAFDKAPRRLNDAYTVQISKAKPSWLDDWRYIWADRTFNRKPRSWVQRLLGW